MTTKGFYRAAVVAMMVAAFPALSTAGKVVGRIVARVNSAIITQRQFEREKQKLRAQLAQEYSGAELETQFREQSKNLLRDMIDQDLMVQKAKELDLNVETDIVKRQDEIRKSLNLATQLDLQNEVEKQGLVWEDFVDNIRRSLLMREVIGREVGRTIVISHEDTRKFFEEHKQQFASPAGVHLAQILISAEKHKPEEAERRSKDALAELKAGERWEDVVKKYSDDQTTANDGGDIGFLKEGTVAPGVASALAKLDIGDFSDIIPLKSGFLIVKVFERRSQGIPNFDEVEQRVSEILYNQKMQPALRQYLANLRRESYITLASGYVDTGAERPSDAFDKTGQ